MADSSSGVGVLNILVAAAIVLMAGGAILYTTGTIGPEQITLLSSK